MFANLRQDMRIIWAIGSKDILDALKNKNTLSNIIIVLLMVAIYSRFSNIFHTDEPLRLFIYDAGRSSLAAELEDESVFRVYNLGSQQSLLKAMASANQRELALVIPPDFDRQVANGDTPELDGYVIHWISGQDADGLVSQVEQEITRLTSQTIHIDLDGHQVYPEPDSDGPPFLASMAMVIAVLILGVGVAPHLMIEEKQTRTLDALLVSPATSGQVVIGKALSGLFYSLIMVVAVLYLNQALILDWGLAILASFLGALLGVGLGLLLGTILEMRQQFVLWGMVVMSALLLPVFLSVMENLLPAWLVAIVDWVPTVALSQMFRVACAANVQFADYGGALALMAISVVLVLALEVWLVHRSDRQLA